MTKDELEKYRLRIEELKIKFSIALKTKDYYKANTYAEELKKITKRIKKEYKEAKRKENKSEWRTRIYVRYIWSMDSSKIHL